MIGDKRVCRICGKTFPDKTGMGRVTLCSDECRKVNNRNSSRRNGQATRDKENYHKWELNKRCSVCGKAFFDDSLCHSRVRCHKCTRANSKRPEHTREREKRCIMCGKHFYDVSYGNTAKMCSRDCVTDRRKQLDSEKMTNVKYERCTWCNHRILNGGLVTTESFALNIAPTRKPLLAMMLT